MLASHFIGKKIYEKGICKGQCNGLLLSQKSHTLKYLSCIIQDKLSTTFYLPFSQIDYVTDVIKLKRFSPAQPNRCDRFFISSPVYDEKGIFLGNVADIELTSATATRIFLDNGHEIPAPAISSCHDAVILKKRSPFPLTQRIPAHAKPLLDDAHKKELFVTKNTLKNAIKKGNLIRFTLALVPFSPTLDDVFSGQF